MTTPAQPGRERLNLLIDAADTLWENHIYFEQAFDEFVRFLDHSTLTPEQIRAVLDEIEIVNNKLHGYGSANFARNLKQCYLHLVEREVQPGDLEKVMSFGECLHLHPIRMMEGVLETLAYLRPRHTLVLFTKGHPEEQRLKIGRSGVEPYFHHLAIVKEKDAAAYRTLAADLDLDPDRTWMVGNSPKSDINPAIQAGLRAVFIPYAHTWTLEREEIRPANGRLLVLERFAQLRDHF
jgi:putative hydrolase of the HAD superfamily